jgi:hypothetical protein
MAWLVPNQLMTGRRFGSVAAALLAALVLVAANGAPAAAAPPEVLASENPVVIPWNQSTKTITLSWNLGNVLPPAGLTVRDGNQTLVLNKSLSTSTGSTTLTVTFGKTYTAQLFTADRSPQPLGSPLTITSTRPPIDPNWVCNANACSASVTFDPHGTYAPFTVTTTKPAHFELQASTDAPLADGSFAHVDSATFNLSNVTEWKSSLPNLEPNTTYYYVLRATDANGQVIKKSGTFKTLRRKVEVTFTSIYMIEDSDILSACDCYFHFQAGDLTPVSLPFMYVNSGDTVSLAVQFALYPVSNTLRLRAEAVDDDYEPFWDLCVNYFGPFWTNGETDCRDWSSVEKWVAVSLTGTEESKLNTYTLTTDDWPVKFTATVKVKVFYAPQ